MSKPCPHCGTLLPEEAAFCPVCVESINERTEPVPPKHISRRTRRRVLAVILAAAVLLGLWLWQRPRTYEGQGEVLYTDRDGTYHLRLAFRADRTEAANLVELPVEPEEDYTAPSRLYVDHEESGAEADSVFRDKIVSAEAAFVTDDGVFTCGQPAPHEAIPDAAMISLVNFTGAEAENQLVWTLHMDSGDTIVLRQDWSLSLLRVHDITPEDEAMGTAEELQALIQRLEMETDPVVDIVNLHLPSATYTEPIEITGRPFNLYGAEGEARTIFTGGIRMTYQDQEAGTWISEFHDLDLQGNGSGVGLSSAGRVSVTGCVFSGWKTGLLAYGHTWANAGDCVFEDNETGFAFNSNQATPADSRFPDNIFRNNGTGLLLENVPTDVTLDLAGTVFSGNGTDIDNRCRQDLDLSRAIFQ